MIWSSYTFASAYLISGTPPFALPSHTILAVLEPEGVDGRVQADETLFGQLGVLRSVAFKVRGERASCNFAPGAGCTRGIEGDGGGRGGKFGGYILSGSELFSMEAGATQELNIWLPSNYGVGVTTASRSATRLGCRRKS